MCSNCKGILPKKTIKHDPSLCPITATQYCGICARYCGHTTLNCFDKEALSMRKPTCLEQLIPGSLLDAYGIMTVTPLPDPSIELQPAYTPVLEVIEKDKNIRAILLNYGKSDKGALKDLKIRLQKLADEIQQKLVYIKPTVTVE